MPSKSFLVIRAAALVLVLGCSGSTPDDTTPVETGDERLFVPEDLPHSELSGEGSGLTLIALTLIEGANGAELYAAVRNDDPTPACSAGMMTNFIDKNDVVVTTTGANLESGKYFRINDGSGVILPCVAPGQIAMTASTELPESVVIAELGRLEYTFPAFGVDVGPVDGLTVSNVATVSRSPGSAYTGTLQNDFDAAVSAPSVAIYPVNRVGRPLGVAKGAATTDIAPAASWTFETSTVTDPGVAQVAFPAATIPF